MRPAIVCYREYAPCAALRHAVTAFFTFVPAQTRPAAGRLMAREVAFRAGESFCSPLFASGHASIAFHFGRWCRADGVWISRPGTPGGEVIGAMSAAGAASLDERPEAIGAFLPAPPARALTGAPAVELTDRVVAMEDLWGPAARELAARLGETDDEGARLDRLESALVRRLGAFSKTSEGVDLAGLAAYVHHRRGGIAVERMAQAAGVSRQHLTRVFRENVGITPKQYCRLARFQAALAYAPHAAKIDWAQAAAQLGYADQSHMIREFRQFSTLTPESLSRERWFHPFIQRPPRALAHGTELS